MLQESSCPSSASIDPNVALIHGRSDVRETALVDACLQSWRQRQLQPSDLSSSERPGSACTIQGKYEQFVGPYQPYSALLEALDSLGQQVFVAGRNGTTPTAAAAAGADAGVGTCMVQREEFDNHIHRALKFEGSILTKMIPNFVRYYELGVGGEQEDNGNSANRVQSAVATK